LAGNATLEVVHGCPGRRARDEVRADRSVLAALLIYAINEYVHRREAPTPTMTPAG
jgi:hypothetical protein